MNPIGMWKQWKVFCGDALKKQQARRQELGITTFGKRVLVEQED